MGPAFSWMKQTERTLQSPGEESAPLSEAGMQERTAHYLSLETLGLHPAQEATVGDRGGREEQRTSSWQPTVEPGVGNKLYQQTEGKTSEEGKARGAGQQSFTANKTWVVYEGPTNFELPVHFT